MIRSIYAEVQKQIYLKIFLSFLLVAIVPLIIANFYINVNYSNRLERELMAHNNLVEESLVANLEDYLRELEYITNLFFNSNIQEQLRKPINPIQLNQNQMSIEKLVRVHLDLFGIMDKVDQVTLVTTNGVAYDVLNMDSRREKIVFNGEEEFTLNTYKNQGIYFLEHASNNDLTQGLRKYVFVRRIDDINGTIGHLYVLFDESEFDNLFYKIKEMSNTHVEVIAKGENCIYSNRPLKHLTSHNKSFKLDNFNLEIVFWHNSKYVDDNIKQLSRMTLIIVLISIIIVLIISRKLTKHLVNPITRLHKKLLRVKEGNYSIRISVDSKDELGDLCHAFNEMTEEIDRLVNQNYSIKLKENEATIAALQTQINPHFLYNTLDMIKSMADIYGIEDVADVILALSRNFRYVTHTASHVVTIRDELENLRNYMKVIKTRYGGQITYEILMEEGIEEYSIIKVCLQPIFENAVAHGLAKKGYKGNIQVTFQIIDHVMTISVFDDGLGMDNNRLEEVEQMLEGHSSAANKKSVGLCNIHDRIQLKYGKAYGLKVSSQEDCGAEVIVRYPAVKYTKDG